MTTAVIGTLAFLLGFQWGKNFAYGRVQAFFESLGEQQQLIEIREKAPWN